MTLSAERRLVDALQKTVLPLIATDRAGGKVFLSDTMAKTRDALRAETSSRRTLQKTLLPL